MDVAKDFTEISPQLSSPAPEIASPAVDRSAAASENSIVESDVSASRENQVIISPVEAGEVGALEKDLGVPVVTGETTLMMPENTTLPRNNGTSLSQSISWSALEAALGNASVPSKDDPPDKQAVEQDASAASGATQNAVVEIVARPLPDDDNDNDHTPYVLLSEEKNGSINQLTAMALTSSLSSKQSVHQMPNIIALKKDQIDTAAPFQSVKSAVSKFGGIVDWKAHHTITVERRKLIEQELVKAHKEIPLYKKLSMDAEEAKLCVLKELESSNRLIEESKLSLEKAQKEEEQARQDAELALLRVAELERGIADESSIVAKAQLEVSRARHASAVSELETVKGELEQLKKDYSLLVAERGVFMKKAEEAVSASKEIEKSVEDLTIQLITVRESLESAHSAHLEAEEHRTGAVMAKEQDVLSWDKDLKQTEEELERVTQQIVSSKDLKSKLDTATALLQELKAELAAYMESKIDIGIDAESNSQDVPSEPRKGTRVDIEASLSSAKKELEELTLNIEKAMDEVNILMTDARSLKTELKKEKAELAAIQQREGMASIAVASLEAELNKTNSEIALAQLKEKEQREKMVELPKDLQVAAQEADQAKALAKGASDELRKAKEEAEQAKARASTMESRLCAAQKEIEAMKASEKLALAEMNAIVESESAHRNDTKDSASGITLSLEEYYDLGKRIQEAEEKANVRVDAALSQIGVAKESELKSMNKLEEAKREKAERKEALQIALQKSEQAEKGKLGVEQELRKWRAENMERRKAGESTPTAINSNRSPKISFDEGLESKSSVSQPSAVSQPNPSPIQQKYTPNSYTSSTPTDTAPQVATKKKKKSFFPKMFMFLSKRKKAHGSKS